MSPPLPARVVLALGLVGLVVAVVNQLNAPQLDPSLERASVLASLLAVVLMVVAALWQRVVPEAAARAPLDGPEGCELGDGLPLSSCTDIFSFGMMMWQVLHPAIQNPFGVLPNVSLHLTKAHNVPCARSLACALS